ncbi:hypothetical protein H5410_038519 [Solanum commersonii]|uniref:Uncharacterized protein n=1 Tax=Solanum commersonii TaxID=4109 RepID=A0A9J5YBK6_SOLCO|nr:hypothetical protein H5410_038519 [Solanum commersonii]
MLNLRSSIKSLMNLLYIKRLNVYCQNEKNKITKTLKMSTEVALYVIWKCVRMSFVGRKTNLLHCSSIISLSL